MGNLKIEEIDGGIVLPVKVVPGSSKTSIAGLLDGMLKVKVSAPPEKGKANQCLIDFLEKKLSVKKNNIKIISGLTNPVKRIEISGISANAVSKKIKIN
ncbi:MAG: DUF167 domain-containing protein [Planctomycetota bacterium]|jgi:uncharacterized protein (TIGR00251 family)